MVIQIVDFAGFIDIKNGDIWDIFVYLSVGNMLILACRCSLLRMRLSCTERQKQQMSWHLSVSSHQLFLLVKHHVGDLVPSILLLLAH